MFVERRFQGDFEERVERALGEIGGYRQRQRGFLHRDVRRELRAHRFDQIVDVLRRPPARAAPQQIDGELREPCLSPRVLAGAGRHRESGVEERKPPLLQGEKRQARGQLLDRQRRQGHVGGHFSTSPGIRVTTLRR